MTDDAPLTPSQEDQALAAELALGLLDGPEAAAATARMSTDANFARIVHDWYERMAGMAEALTPVMAPARARQAIRERLGHINAPLANDPTERRAWFDPPWNPGSTVLMHRQPDDIWRIDYQLRVGQSTEAALQPEAVTEFVQRGRDSAGPGGRRLGPGRAVGHGRRSSRSAARAAPTVTPARLWPGKLWSPTRVQLPRPKRCCRGGSQPVWA